MNRFVFGLALLTAACSGKNGAAGGTDSLCTGKNPPAACDTACNPVSGAADCPDGFHCAADGKCDAQCTATGNECGAGNSCTNDGLCQAGDGPPGGPPPVDASCPAVHFAPSRVTPSIEIVFDKSGSMAHDFDDHTIPAGSMIQSKFTAEQDALVNPNTGILVKLQNSAYFGIKMFPADQCGDTFDVSRALKNATNIGNLIAAHHPDGNTPTALAIDDAVQDFHNHPPPAGSPPIIVLSTDGDPNDCSSTTTNRPPVLQAVKDAFTAGVKTYILRVGNVFPADFAQSLANAGLGVQSGATAYSATDPTTMAAAFQQIIGGAVSCDLTLNGKIDTAQASTGTVTLGNTKLVYGTDWQLDADGKTIHILGTACTTLKNTGGTVDASFPCGAVLL